MNILGIVARDRLTNIAQVPPARRTSLKHKDTRRPLHSAPHDSSSACSAALKLAPREGKKPEIQKLFCRIMNLNRIYEIC